MASRYVAERHLKWGDRPIAPGDPVPEGDPDRDYGLMVRNGDIRDVSAPGRESVDADALARIERKVDALLAAVGVDAKAEPEKAPEAEAPTAEDEDKEGDAKPHGRKAKG